MKPFVVKIRPGGKYQKLLGGPPRTVGFLSGRIVVRPGKSVGRHSTGRYEEILVVLQGRGEAVCKGRKPLRFTKGDLVYIPPRTEHDMKNVGKGLLKYIYIVAPT